MRPKEVKCPIKRAGVWLDWQQIVVFCVFSYIVGTQPVVRATRLSWLSTGYRWADCERAICASCSFFNPLNRLCVLLPNHAQN